MLNTAPDSWAGMEEGRWSVYGIVDGMGDAATSYGAGVIDQAQVIQIIRDLKEQNVNGIPGNAYINTTGSNMDTDFDFHTGVWTVQVPVEGSDRHFVVRLDQDGNLMSAMYQ